MTGIQEKFSWNAVALAAVGGGVSAGLSGGASGASASGTAGAGSAIANGWQAAGRAVLTNLATQGVGLALGWQSKFSWAGLAASGVGAGLAKAIAGKALGDYLSPTNAGLNVAAQTASGIANAAIRSLISGTDFGDNLMAALPDVIGSTIGEAIAGKIGSELEEARIEKQIRADRAASQAARRSEAYEGIKNIGQGIEDVVARWEPAPSSGDERRNLWNISTEEFIQGIADQQGPSGRLYQIEQKGGNALGDGAKWLKEGLIDHPLEDMKYRSDHGWESMQLALSRRTSESQWDAIANLGLFASGFVENAFAPIYGLADAAVGRPIEQIFGGGEARRRWAGDGAFMIASEGLGAIALTARSGSISGKWSTPEVFEAAEDVAASSRTYNGGAFGRLSAEKGVIERHHVPADSVSPYTTYSGPAIQMDYADHLLTSSHGGRGLEGALYRADIKALIDNGDMRGAMAKEILDIRRVSTQSTGSPTKYNAATLQMLDYAYSKGFLNKVP